MLIEIYTDGAYSPSTVKKFNNKGLIAYKMPGVEAVIQEVKLYKISGLKQYANLVELMAIQKALEYILSEFGREDVILHSDSKTACSWVKRKVNDLDRFSDYHAQAKKEIDLIINQELSSFEIRWVPRENNLAGIALEKITKRIKNARVKKAKRLRKREQVIELSDITDYVLRQSLHATRQQREGIPLRQVARIISEEFSLAEVNALIENLCQQKEK